MVANSNAGLFSSTAINPATGELVLDYAPDASGTTDLTIRATDTGGLFAEAMFSVTVTPSNDVPTSSGIGDVVVTEDAANTVVDLFGAFSDVEDADSGVDHRDNRPTKRCRQVWPQVDQPGKFGVGKWGNGWGVRLINAQRFGEL